MSFDNSRKLTWYVTTMAGALCVLIVFRPSPEAAQVLMLAVPSMLALVGAWTKFVNDAESK